MFHYLLVVIILQFLYNSGTPIEHINFADCNITDHAVCFQFPANCTPAGSNPCTVAARISKNESNFILLELTAKRLTDQPLQYIALGFSHDMGMADSSVTECVYDENAQKADVYLSYNPGPTGHHTPNQRIHNNSMTEKILKMEEFGILDDLLICRYQRMVDMPFDDSRIASLNQYFHLLLVTYYAAPDNVKMHVTDRSNVLFPQVTSMAYNFKTWNQTDSGLSAEQRRSFKMKQAHGILMIFAIWILIIPGMLIARYFREAFPDITVYDLKIWFQLHRTLNFTGVIVISIAFILVLASKNWQFSGYIVKHITPNNIHSYFGLASVIGAVLQPLGALLRCHPDHRQRYVFSWIHRTTGFSVFVFSSVTIILATQMPMGLHKELRRDTPLVLICVLLATVILTVILMEVDIRLKGNQDNSNDSVSDIPLIHADEGLKVSRLRSLLLGLLMLVNISFFITMACFIGTAPPVEI